jgi:hypothetical protein
MARWPAVVTAYAADPRQCEVSIPGITEGGSLHAEIEQSLGDRSENTEIRIKAGDRVWVDFLANDTRYPIITGFRAKNVGNMVGTRHWEHENFTLDADETVLIKAGQSIRLEAGAFIELVVGDNLVRIDTSTIAQVAAQLTIQGPVAQTGGDMTSDGISVQGHVHIEQGDGLAVSPPQ